MEADHVGKLCKVCNKRLIQDEEGLVSIDYDNRFFVSSQNLCIRAIRDPFQHSGHGQDLVSLYILRP